jgi:hypothetical protein
MTVMEDITLIRYSSSSDNTSPFIGCGCIKNGSYRMDETVYLGCIFVFVLRRELDVIQKLLSQSTPTTSSACWVQLLERTNTKTKKDCLHAVLRVISSSCFFSLRISVMLN